MAVENSILIRDSKGKEIVEGAQIKEGDVKFSGQTKPFSQVSVFDNGQRRFSSEAGPDNSFGTALIPFKAGAHTVTTKFDHLNEEQKLSFTVVSD
ncbi:hypothetical protein [Pseudomonas sp. SW-3]|jgi:hypothetical protein|uniref:hypothetical protein n=1 Tax=Pseudomonas sp. SW-3 TaxID=147212 RepID=UPI00190AE3AF|nr:hypothetical protein [Pseudomonas sp. SW-3]QQN99987.1 hypothetical protein JIO00_05460 [Pseudomonas sp. SW-3]